ncbi:MULTISPECIES: GNAT family N-acetyltransferase [unclassified Virgibacillus]|uniref:GNAT family N-acetyltransferase n=1 Tax=unclassified Virgibacillus TaxID=2620237 RepID=UPI0024DE83F0|nr:GNAT family N-acetyltransferase [Virgibacillus sp. LDC-1]
MEIKEGNNTFYLGDSEQHAKAEITYVEKGQSIWIIDHTYVSKELRGQGIAALLMEKLLAHAEANNKKIIPQCSYAAAYMQSNKKYQSLLADGFK